MLIQKLNKNIMIILYKNILLIKSVLCENWDLRFTKYLKKRTM